jgi:hypothetical protein
LTGYVAAATKRAKPLFKEEELNYSQLTVAANHAASYEEAYTLMRGVFASRVLERVKQIGVANARSEITALMSNKQYPTIHKGE